MSTRKSLCAALMFTLVLPVASTYAADFKSPVTLVSQTELPDIVGDFDHLTVDLKRGHLFVTAEVHHSVEVFDLKTGKHLQSVGGFKTPHSIAYAPEKDELMVCDGGDSSLVLLSGEDFHRLDRVQLIDGSATGKGDSPDAALYDKVNHLYYIGNGGVSANMPTSKISIFSVDQGKVIGDMDVDGNNVEAMGIDPSANRLYVNIRDKKQIGVYDLATRKLVTTWTAPDINRNTALMVDSRSHRVFVGGRKPAFLYVFDPDGKVVQKLSMVENNDDMNWDPAAKLLYVSGSQGLSIFQQENPDSYTEVARIPTNGGKTALLVPQENLFFVVHPKTDIDTAGLLVYRVKP
ncbi:YncE family protein [Silvibacterium acidisoli]|uniref:YncE family protein n=1 Tax=Acidobacteriaceae bacterium ZG23-2 TaxID=2883246 RepID=UPI00406C9A62